jgi:hypothetical protein
MGPWHGGDTDEWATRREDIASRILMIQLGLDDLQRVMSDDEKRLACHDSVNSLEEKTALGDWAEKRLLEVDIKLSGVAIVLRTLHEAA